MRILRWTAFFLLLSFPAFAQSISGGNTAPILPPIQAKNNVTLVYSTVNGNLLMTVIDAIDLTDPSFNPPNSTQVSIPPATYNAMTPDSFQAFVSANAPSVAVSP